MPLDWSVVLEKYGQGAKVPTITGGKFLQVARATDAAIYIECPIWSATLEREHLEKGVHVIGIGRTGAAYVEALLRTGEIEDHLADPRATFAAMVVDIGDQDMGLPQDYAASFIKRLESRGIPTDRFQFQSIALPVPSKDEFFEGMNRTREFLKLEYPRYY